MSFNPRLLLVIGWLLVNGFFLLNNGIITTGEAGKYISEAHQLVQTGHLTSNNFIFYSEIGRAHV